MEIIRQVDSSDMGGISDGIVGFVEAVDVFRGRGALTEWTEHRYFATVYTRPISASATPLVSCKHMHLDIPAAYKCVRRLLKQQTLKGSK